MPSGADRCLATEPSRSTTPWCGTLNREHELQRRPITLTARVHNALDKPRSFIDAALVGRDRLDAVNALSGQHVATLILSRDSRTASWRTSLWTMNVLPQRAATQKSRVQVWPLRRRPGVECGALVSRTVETSIRGRGFRPGPWGSRSPRRCW